MKILNYFFLLITTFLMVNCKKGLNKANDFKTKQTQIVNEASSFNLIESESSWNYQMIRGEDTISQKILKSQLPFKNISVMSSSAIGYLESLNALENVKAVYNSNWIYSPKVHELIDNNGITDAGNLASANMETVLITEPDAVITFSAPNQAKLMESIKKMNIPVIYMDEYLEKTPLGKSEYLKLFGILLDKEVKADSLFGVVKKEYNLLKEKALSSKTKPTVFAEIMRGDIWYMPGGKSFQSEYFNDSGADYLWKNDDKSGTVNLNFEQVIKRAEQADFWMNASDFSTLEQLKNSYKNHDWFNAFKNNHVYSFSNRTNKEGANDYFETGAVRADWVLKDLIQVFHPNLLPQRELYFYKKLH